MKEDQENEEQQEDKRREEREGTRLGSNGEEN